MLDAPRRTPETVVLLGAQRFDKTLGSTVRALEVKGPIAVVTAGWQERESEDEELCEHLDCEVVNLRLHARSEEVFAEDKELAAAHRHRQETLRHKQDFYRIRLEHELEANHVIRQRKAPPDVLAEEERASIAAIRALDEYHLKECARVHHAHDMEVRLAERPIMQRHRQELGDIMARCSALAIAGGHVASLTNRLRMFGVRGFIDGHAIFAWTAGAMAVSERVVLFHDRPPQGPGASEILDVGLGLVPDVVVLPEPEARLRLDDRGRVSVLARRFSPARCLALPAGAHVTARKGRLERSSGVLELREDGTCFPFNPDDDRADR